MGLLPALLANALILGTLAYFFALDEYASDFFYRSVQEDEYLEWGTFWGFMAAAGLCVWGAVLQRRTTRKLPWFFLGVALFCFVVAMEEISWGQRVVGYRPPVYFLEHNYQQELNVHNVMSRELRMGSVKVVILAYGVVLPLLALIPLVRRLLLRLAVAVPPWELIPSFLATYWAYEEYPLKFSGEIVEFMLGLGFLFAAIVRVGDYAPPRRVGGRPGRRVALIAASFAVVLAVGSATAWGSRARRSADPGNLEAARAELAAIERDFLAEAEDSDLPTRCGMHKRLYTFTRQYNQRFLGRGDFAALQAQGLPEERAEFLIDPWNTPYWIRDRCSRKRGKRVVFVYSFGPNRRRESSKWEILGDDVGVVLLEERREKSESSEAKSEVQPEGGA